MYRILTVVVVLVCGSTTNAQVRLVHKLPNGIASTNTTAIKTDQTLTIAGMNVETGATQQLVISSTNGNRGADGKITVHHKIDVLKADVTIAGQQLSFDSANPDAPPPGTAIDSMLDVFKAMSKSEWTTVHGPDNRVLEVNGRDEALASLPEAVREATKALMEPKYLAQQANDQMARIPTQPVSPGDRWGLNSSLRLEAGQTLAFTAEYTYEGVVSYDGRAVHKITAKTTDVGYDMAANAPGPLKYVNSDLSVADSEGTILFDNELGRVVSSRSKVQIEGPMTFEINGQQLPAQLDLTLENSTTLAN